MIKIKKSAVYPLETAFGTKACFMEFIEKYGDKFDSKLDLVIALRDHIGIAPITSKTYISKLLPPGHKFRQGSIGPRPIRQHPTSTKIPIYRQIPILLNSIAHKITSRKQAITFLVEEHGFNKGTASLYYSEWLQEHSEVSKRISAIRKLNRERKERVHKYRIKRNKLARAILELQDIYTMHERNQLFLESVEIEARVFDDRPLTLHVLNILTRAGKIDG